MIIQNEDEMMTLGKKVAKEVTLPFCIELRGDVGVGKTTFVRGLAEGLGIKESVTSPSFLISKRYEFPEGELVHYDFYRLDDPGIMSDELNEAINSPKAAVVVEWAGEVEGVLPSKRKIIEIKYLENGEREVKW